MHDGSWLPGGCWSIATSNVLIVLIASGLLGSFFYYIVIHGLIRGKLKQSWEVWSYGVGAGSLLVSVSTSVAAHFCGAEGGLKIVMAIWPLIMLPLHGGYWAIAVHMSEKHSKEKERESEPL